MTNPLFPNFNQESARLREAQMVLNELDRLSGQKDSHSRQRLLSRMERLRSVSRGVSRELDNLIREMIAEARDSNNPPSVFGIVGRALADMLGFGDKGNSRVKNRIRQAANILQQISPEAFGDVPRKTPEESGGELIPNPPPPRDLSTQAAQSSLPEGVRMVGSNVVEINKRGFRRRYRTNDPTVTGQMIAVRSSNVHSIGFHMSLSDPVRSLLLVRFLQPDENGGSVRVPGPTYGYKDIHPDMFVAMVRANSKGKFVWDNLRIRGTVAGHQVPYSLMKISQGNVPRRAVLINGQQWLRPRAKIGYVNGRRTVFRSSKPLQRIGRYRPKTNQPNRGNPDQGRRGR